MKTQSIFLKNYFLIIALLGAVMITSMRAASFSMSPATISNLYGGVLTLDIGGLTNGEPVSVERYLDANADGVLDEGEPLVDSFRIVDGGANVINGVTNINVPYDHNAATGAITTTLNIGAPQPLQNLVGSYIFRVLSPGNNFAPTNATFVITNSALPQFVSGTIFSNGIAPLAGAVVVALDASGQDNGGGRYVAGAVADANGHYQLNLNPGTYVLLPTRPGFFADQSLAAMVVLANGMSATNDLYLTNATASVSGNAHNLGNGSPLGGVMVMLEGGNGYLAITFTQTNGNYVAGVTPGFWQVRVESDLMARRAFVVPQQVIQVDTTTGSVANVNIALPKANALIYGTFTNASGAPIVNFNMSASDAGDQHEAGGATDANGNYCVAVLGGTNEWYCSPSDDYVAQASYIVSSSPGTNLAAGEAQLRNFTAILATNHITGSVKGSGNQPITNLYVSASSIINGVNFYVSRPTDIDGAFSLKVTPGSWSVGLDCNYVESLGYFCPGQQLTNLVSADVVVNFVVSTLQITTASLPDATNDIYYSYTFAASGGQPPYSWSLSPGAPPLPDGMTVDTNGILSGTPTFTGSPAIGVRVTDSQNATADQFLWLNIVPAPLQITTTSLPDGTDGAFYYQQLTVSGGTPPYSWYLPGGSGGLPSGLSLGTNGLISGTPTTNGLFNFDVAVYVNSPYQVATQSLSLTITAAPLQVTTTSPLPGATEGAYYSCQLMATGGYPPYSWSLAPYSLSLPNGLTLSTNGLLSGTPLVNGSFYFTVRVTDSVMATNDWGLSLTVASSSGPPPVLLHGPAYLGNGEFQFSFDAAAGTNYTIQYTTTLSGPWNSVLTIAGSGGPITIIDPNATGPQRFYRLRIEP